MAQQGFFVKALAEEKVTELPPGDLFWHLATFDTKEQAQVAAGPLGWVAEYDGKVWLFRLGRAGEGQREAHRSPRSDRCLGSQPESICCG